MLLLSGALALLGREEQEWVEVAGHRYDVEIANTPDTLQKGLMFRERLAQDRGMLFIFDQEYPLAFWMKNTHIPLDILYFNSEGVLVDQKRGATPCKADPCPNYQSALPAQYVLELNAGEAARINLENGARLRSNAKDATALSR